MRQHVKGYLFLMLCCIAMASTMAQGVRISAMPTYPGPGDDVYVPIVVDGQNKKIQGKLLGQNRMDSIVNAMSGLTLGNDRQVVKSTIDSLRALHVDVFHTYTYFSDGKQWDFYVDPISTDDDDGVTVLETAGGQRLKRILTGEVEANWFATGDGTTNDLANLQKAYNFATANNQNLQLNGSYSLGAGALQVHGTNIFVYGIGKSELKTSGDKVIEVDGNLTNAVFENMWWTSTGSSGDFYGLFTSDNHIVDGATFRYIRATAPTAVTNAWKFIQSGSNWSRNLRFDHIDLINIGQMGWEFQNHDYDGVYRIMNVFINDVYSNGTGTASDYGFLFSFSGRTKGATITNFHAKKAKGIVLELAGSTKDIIVDNGIMDSLVTGCSPISITNSISGSPGDTWYHENISIDHVIATADARVNLYRLKNSYIGKGNNFTFTGTSGYVQLKDGIRSTYMMTVTTPAQYAVFCTSASPQSFESNYILGATLDNSASSSNSAVVQMDGILTSNNVVAGCSMYKGIGGFYFAQTNSANENTSYGNIPDNDPDLLDYQAVSMTDADYAMDQQNDVAKFLRFNGTLTATRTITVPPGKAGMLHVYNGTGQSLIFTTGSGNTVTVPTLSTASLGLDGTNVRLMSGSAFFDNPNFTNQVTTTTNYRVLKASADLLGGNVILNKRGTTGNIDGAVTSGSELGSIYTRGWDGSLYGDGTLIISFATENWSTIAHGSKMQFRVVPNGSTTKVTALELGQDKTVTMSKYTAGYGHFDASGNISSLAAVPQSDVSGFTAAPNSTWTDSALFKNRSTGDVEMARINPPTSVDWVAAFQDLGSSIKAPAVGTDWNGAGAATTLTDGRVYFIAIWVPRPMTLTGIGYQVFTSGSYTADNTNQIGLYSHSGTNLTLVASSSDDGTMWAAGTSVITKKAFATPVVVSRGVYYAAILWNASATTTAPQLNSSPADADKLSQFDFTTGLFVSSFKGSSSTVLPSTYDMATATIGNNNFIIFGY